MRVRCAIEEQPSFPEFVHGKKLTPGGTPLLGWGAAAAIIGEHALRGQRVIRINDKEPGGSTGSRPGYH